MERKENRTEKGKCSDIYCIYIYIAQALRSTLCEKFMERENDDIISFIDTQSAKHSLANAKVSRDIKVQHFV